MSERALDEPDPAERDDDAVPVDEKVLQTALVHLYRGELGRMTTYRVRLDTTTNWAVGTSAALVSFTLGDDAVPHYVLMLATFLVIGFAWMEARRFQTFEMIRLRVRILERGYYTELLGGAPSEDWRGEIRAALERPHRGLSMLSALSVRIRRNYLWLLGAVLAAWLLKLHLAGGPWAAAAAVGPLPGGVTLALAGALSIATLGVATLHREGRERG
ncbi:MAG TPA: DUF2270 domain-containing protein [Sandaracinaceae bacterium LLY-WYZ-13_1]|nr:DUF2270 domain-containing protein [Sandaracinaceae bacterium LLY-WYZ-13_1]